jgi:serine/threonine-protein kinase RsbW
MADVELDIPPRSAYVAVVRLAIASLARAAGMEEDAVDDLKIAVSEACTNAVLAHDEAGSQEPVSVRWSAEPTRVIVEVGDRGAAYDSEQRLEDSQGFSNRSAMSVALLSSLADEIAMEHRDGGGTWARLVVNL